MKTGRPEPVLQVDLAELPLVSRGKVRDIYAHEQGLLLVATDRVSAFDVVMAEGIPHKGRVLTFLSEFWFRQLADVIPNHLITTDIERMPADLRSCRDLLAGRTMLVRRARPLPVEFVVRGYLAGSALGEYRETGQVCGLRLPPGLEESARLPQPILTPTTKATTGHDLALTFEQVEDLVGIGVARAARDAALEIFRRAHALALERGLLLADTKFEFGMLDGELVWIDEALTPDSSRYWAQSTYRAGRPQEPFDKQLLRNYLLAAGWARRPPPPPLSEDIIRRTSERYLEVAEILTGRSPLAPGGLAT
ncbi:MAG: phosphoribosylaminoimidazolesuccinocarboxamide synthase [Planctomycetes bacterium]|nr:phosphoribosylaminoimidazolesuccinocarboxamide synthase [Planctomycetota bacterium]